MPKVLNDFTLPPRTVDAFRIRNVTVIAMDSPRPLPAHSVTIDDGVITAVEPDDGSRPIDAGDIDGTGLFLMPGLADMHVHFRDPAAFGMFLANGVTVVRNMSGEVSNLAFEQQVRSGTLPGPHVVTTGPIVDGSGESGLTIWPSNVLLDDPADAERLVRSYVERGYHQIKAYSWLRLDALRALGRAAADAGVRVTGHCPEGVSVEQAMDAGMSCFEHLMSIAVDHLEPGERLSQRRSMESDFGPDAIRYIAHHLDYDAVGRLAGKLAARQVWNCPTTVTWQGQIGDVTELDRERLRYEPPAAVTRWHPDRELEFRETYGLAGSTEDWGDIYRARVDAHLRVVSLLHREGAPLLLGTDAHTPWVFEGFSVHDELDNFVRAGLSPYEALRCGTREAARFLGQESQWGTVAPGRRADLILSEANPLEDITTLRDPRAVLTNGYRLERSDLAQLLDTRDQVAHRPLPAPTRSAPPPAAASSTELEMIVRHAGVEAGRMRYRHSRFEDGAWLVEEHYTGHAEEGQLTRRCAWRITSELVLERGNCTTTTLLGTNTYEVSRTNAGYELVATEVDGCRIRHSIAADAVLPTDSLSSTAWSLLLAHGGADRAAPQSLAYANGAPVVDSVSLHPRDAAAGDSGWELVFARPGSVRTWLVDLDASGSVRRMEQSGWSGQQLLEALT